MLHQSEAHTKPGLLSKKQFYVDASSYITRSGCLLSLPGERQSNEVVSQFHYYSNILNSASHFFSVQICQGMGLNKYNFTADIIYFWLPQCNFNSIEVCDPYTVGYFHNMLLRNENFGSYSHNTILVLSAMFGGCL